MTGLFPTAVSSSLILSAMMRSIGTETSHVYAEAFQRNEFKLTHNAGPTETNNQPGMNAAPTGTACIFALLIQARRTKDYRFFLRISIAGKNRFSVRDFAMIASIFATISGLLPAMSRSSPGSASRS